MGTVNRQGRASSACDAVRRARVYVRIAAGRDAALAASCLPSSLARAFAAIMDAHAERRCLGWRALPKLSTRGRHDDASNSRASPSRRGCARSCGAMRMLGSWATTATNGSLPISAPLGGALLRAPERPWERACWRPCWRNAARRGRLHAGLDASARTGRQRDDGVRDHCHRGGR